MRRPAFTGLSVGQKSWSVVGRLRGGRGGGPSDSGGGCGRGGKGEPRREV